SLGVTLFEFTFGKLPYSFETKSVEERLKAHQFKPVEFPEVWPETVPTIWRKVLERLLAKDRGQRYQSYDELIRDLEDAKPLSVPSAGLIPRGLAWLVDVLLLLIVTVVLFLPVKLGVLVELLGNQPVLEWLIRLIAAFGIPAVAISYQWLRGVTPGKELFQLRVVDSHGAAASRSQIAYRTGMQFLFLWSASVLGVLDELGFETNDILTSLIVMIPLLIEMGYVVISKKGLALHDRLFRTRVVLDARDSSD
ncbi:RDD family protein, partial [Verrucomicrobia bacterium]|nr:RDD family protein [Verrucomicrobiota bacterium]